jgi:hypothetical protein
VVVGYVCLCGIRITVDAVRHCILANAGNSDEDWDICECRAQQVVGKTGHGNPATFSLAVKASNHVIGKLW